MGDKWSVLTDIKRIDHDILIQWSTHSSSLLLYFALIECIVFARNALKWIFKCLWMSTSKEFECTNKMPFQQICFWLMCVCFICISFAFLWISIPWSSHLYKIIMPIAYFLCSFHWNENTKKNNEYCTFLKRMQIFERLLNEMTLNVETTFFLIKNITDYSFSCCTSAYSYAHKCFIGEKRNQLRNQQTFFVRTNYFEITLFILFKYFVAKFNI